MGTESANWIYLDPIKIRSNIFFKQTGCNIKESSIFSSSPYGGPTAVANSTANGSCWEIVVQTCSGIELSTIKVPNLHSLYWTRCHRLIIVGSRGRVLVYTPLGKVKNQFSIDQEVAVAESRVFHSSSGNTGLAILTETNRIFAVNSVLEAVPWRIPDVARAGRPAAWSVLAAPSSPTTILFVLGDNFYAGMQGFAPQLLAAPWKLSEGRYTEIVPNWDCCRVAIAHSSHIVQIVNSDFSLMATISFSDPSLITSQLLPSLYWCASEAVAMKSSRKTVLLSSLSSEMHTLIFDGDVRLDSEIDGIKVFTADQLVFFSLVPEEVECVFGIGSAEPGAILYDASDMLAKGVGGVYDYIHVIENNLHKGVQQCLMAAAHQFSPSIQKKLLKAASLGKSLSRRQDASQYVDTCREMRVLNSLRLSHIGIAISFFQLMELTMTALIDRLIEIAQWPLAIVLCDYMRVVSKEGVHRVLAHWALTKIEKAKAEKSGGKIPDYPLLSEMIVNRFSNFPEVPFADVAMKAVEAGLPELAELLLEKETRLSRQVEMLLKLNKVEKALAKAARSQQPDLLNLVLAHLKRTQKKEVIDHLMLKLPQAMCLYQDYLREEAPRHVLALYEQNDDFARQAVYHLRESEALPWNPFDFKDKAEGLSKAEKCLRNLKESGMEQLLADATSVLKMCDSYDGKPDFVDVDRTNVRAVFMWAASHQEEAFAEQLRKTFKLSDKLCCVWKVEAFARFGKWQHLESLSKSKKLSVGFMTIIEACSTYGNLELGESLIDKLVNPEEIVEAYLLLGKPEEAAKVAVEKKMPATVSALHSKYCNDPVVGQRVLAILNTFKKSG